ncbi:hypothetical protein CYB_0981 [Synechococcus sp. JA-2-3B'a(2-13)]|nr:hypothetical protein CYB_0981 [Synechococcus sp. JA-2-3B'a(2-13)]
MSFYFSEQGILMIRWGSLAVCTSSMAEVWASSLF